MNKIIVGMLLMLSVSAQAFSYKAECDRQLFEKPLKLNSGEWVGINSFTLQGDETQNTAVMNVGFKSAQDLANTDSPETLKPKDYSEVFTFDTARGGMFFQIIPSPNNVMDVGGAYIEIGELQGLVTAGPVPDGTYPVKITLAWIASKTSEQKPMFVKEFVLDCKMTIKN